MKLNQGPRSTGYYLLNSLKLTRGMERDLQKGLNQIEEADRIYAKSRRRPDDRFLTGSVDRLNQAQSTLKKLEAELHDAYGELKSDIRQAIISQ